MFGLKGFLKKGRKKSTARQAVQKALVDDDKALEAAAEPASPADFARTPISASLQEERKMDERFLTHQDGVPLATGDWRDQVEWGWTTESGVQNSACFGMVMEEGERHFGGVAVSESDGDDWQGGDDNAPEQQRAEATTPASGHFYTPPDDGIAVTEEHWDEALEAEFSAGTVVGALPPGQAAGEANADAADAPVAATPAAATAQTATAQTATAQTATEQTTTEQAATEQATAEQAVAPAAAAGKPRKSWLARLKTGLTRTGNHFTSLVGLRQIDEELLEELEDALLMADCGVEATTWLIDALRQRWKDDGLKTAAELRRALAALFADLLTPLQQPLVADGQQPFIIMMVGVNGAGKTTSIGKLAKYFQAQGKSVLLAAGDTFRAAAREQLATWGERNNVEVLSQKSADPAAVIYDAVTTARARKIDIVLADTAGRLPTQLHLMEEIAKVRRVIAKADASGPHEVLLVLDGNVGQNALAQLKAFDEAVKVSGLIVTKLDGTAKGGVMAAIARQYPRPLRFIGVGEGIDDLQPFVATEFVSALFADGKK